MRTVHCLLAIVTLGAGCAAEPPDTGTATQELAKLRACFTDLGQPDPAVPLSRRFDAGCSTPTPGSTIWKYNWEFGDGAFLQTGNTVSDHVFPFTNTCYKVHLTVLDVNGKTDDVFHYALFCSVGPCNPPCPP